jgi:pimeloyl-ACP methyl ester carboxylesterase
MHESLYIDAGDTTTRYITAGQGEPVVLVHGGHFGLRGSAEDWEPAFELLSRHHRVIAYDKVGMGFSDNPPSSDQYVIDTTAHHLLDLLDALEIDRAHLIGHSRGGYAVTRLAIDHPDRVRTLTIVASSSVTVPFNPIYAEWRAHAATLDDREAVRYLIAANSFSEDHITETMVEVGVQIGRLEKLGEAADIMNQGGYEAFKADLLQRVEEIRSDVASGRLTVPTLIAWGYNDPSATIERCAKPALDIFFPHVDQCEMFVMNHAGHYCFREQPEAFIQAVLAFIARTSAPTGG